MVVTPLARACAALKAAEITRFAPA